MQGVILAAGRGTRMRPLTNTVPKPLILIAGRPLLAHILDALPPAIDSLVIVVKYLQEHLRRFGTVYRGLPITYVTQGTPEGTGGALRAAEQVLDDRFLVLLADDLHGREALELLVQEPLALLGAVAREPQHYGVLTLSHAHTLVAIEEKPTHPKSNLVNTGAMVLNRRIFAYDAPEVNGELRLTDLVVQYAHDVPIKVIEQPLWCPIGRPADIATGEAFVRAYGER